MPDKYLIQRGVPERVTFPHTFAEGETTGTTFDVGSTTSIPHDVIAWVDVALIEEPDTESYWRKSDALANYLDEHYADANDTGRNGKWRVLDPQFLFEQTTEPVTETQTTAVRGDDDTWAPTLPVPDLDIPF